MPNPDAHQSKVRSTSSSRCSGQSKTLCPGMLKPDRCSRPQTTLKIFCDRFLDHICNTRLRNLKEKTQDSTSECFTYVPGVKNRAPDTLSRHPTGDHHPPKVVLHDDVHSIQDCDVTPPPNIPTQLTAGICIDDQLHSIRMENQLQESLLSSTHTVSIILGASPNCYIVRRQYAPPSLHHRK